MKKISINIQLSSRQLYGILFFIVMVNCIVLIGTFLCNSIEWNKQNFLIGFIFRETNLAWENTSATWYSSMLLLIVAMLAIVCFISDRQNTTKRYDKFTSYGWIIISLIFTALSLDEVGSIHESIREISLFKSLGIHGGLSSNSFYLFIGIVAFFMLLFGVFKFKNNKWSNFLGFAGVLLFITNPLNERFEWSQVPAGADLSLYKRNAYFIVLEEGTEIFGAFCFITSLVKYLIGTHKKISHLENYLLTINYMLNKKTIFYGALIIISFLCILNGIVQYQFLNIERMDNGMPENWFPGAAAFITSFLSLYLYYARKKASSSNHTSLLLFSCLTLIISFYVGSNIYNRVFEKNNSLSMLPIIILLTMIVATGGIILLKNKSLLSRIGISIWTILSCISLVFHSAYSSSLIFISFCILNFLFFSELQKTSTIKSPPIAAAYNSL